MRRHRLVLATRVMCALLAVATMGACGAPSSDSRADSGGVSATTVAPSRDSVGFIAAAGMPADSFPAPRRPVADIVAPRWTNEDARDDVGEFARVASLAGVKGGMHVADIGAGDGYYVVRLSPIVGDSGRVYAQDIVPDYLALLSERVRREGLRNVTIARGEGHDPRLPAGSIDVAFMIHMYHEIDQPFGLLWNLATALRPRGQVAILDLDRPTFGHGTPPSLLRCELRTIGYTERSFTRTGEEYIAIYEAPALSARPSPASIRAALLRAPCRAGGDDADSMAGSR